MSRTRRHHLSRAATATISVMSGWQFRHQENSK
ncbi:hypothetical protein ES319_A07G214900v1 [Gossypium barbadense]|uniref:Uncharacterized protein n=1 Tax=Gossypium barbadense TaxID=3634 RepID=A0A5J5V6J4_GOSBA|nr:hypothetical protein ES319_A07G214900v1 [Gossypium barbadense]